MEPTLHTDSYFGTAKTLLLRGRSCGGGLIALYILPFLLMDLVFFLV